MTLHFINAQLIDPEAGTVTRGTLRVEDGKIAAVLDDTAPIPGDAQVVDCRGKYLAPGIVDLGVKVCEPGERHKESFRSAGLAAAAGGVTTPTPPSTAPKCLNSSPAVRTRPRRSTSCPWLR
jgi:dihydroorotase